MGILPIPRSHKAFKTLSPDANKTQKTLGTVA